MNTPNPCNTCKHLYWNCTDNTEPVECKKNLTIGDTKCPGYEYWEDQDIIATRMNEEE